LRKLLVLGAGTAGTMIVNRLRRRLDPAEWSITVVDADDVHPYQPGYLFLPFHILSPSRSPTRAMLACPMAWTS